MVPCYHGDAHSLNSVVFGWWDEHGCDGAAPLLKAHMEKLQA